MPALSLVETTYYDIDDLVDASRIESAARQGIALFLRQYPGLAARDRAWLSTAELSIGGSHAYEDGEHSYYLRLDLAHGEDEDSFRFDVDPFKLTARDFAQALRNIVYQVDGFSRLSAPPPQLVRRFAADAFQTDPGLGPVMPATGIAILPDGRIALGHGRYVSLLDPFLRLNGTVGRELARDGISSGSGLLASASGTLLSAGRDAGELVVHTLPDQGTWTVSTGLGSIESLAWLSDGTLVAKEARVPRVVAIGQGRRQEIKLPEFTLNNETSILAAGPDGSFFSLNPAKKYLSLYDRTGRLLDRNIPCLGEKQYAQVRALKWLPDGGFLVRGTNFLCRLDAGGELVWLLPLDPALGERILDAAWAEREQSVYVILPDNRTVFQYREAAALPPTPAAGLPDYALLARLDADLRAGAEGDPQRAMADWYRAAGAVDYALSLYQASLRQAPGDRTLVRTVAELRANQLLATAAGLDARVRATLRDIGPESARADYSEAMKQYEQALALKPGNAAILQARTTLARALRDAEAGLAEPVPPLTLEEGELVPIFPALLAAYREHPLATLSVRNDTGQPVGDIRASLFIPRFMDFASEAKTVPSLATGEARNIDLFATFNQEALGVEEDLPVQARIRLEWTANGRTESLERSWPGLVYRRSALTWDDSGKLAAFITPNEDSVNRFALSLVDAAAQSPGPAGARLTGFAPRLQRVEAIINGLSAWRMQYLEDPQTPLSRVLGQTMAVDTVRFPRTTLFYHNGDCDDLSALLASLLEAAGVPTAIVTSPGHVFLAFDSGLGADRAWILEGLGATINHQGSLWIPLESTVLGKGLKGSWAEASPLVTRWRGSVEMAFLPTAGLRGRYPPVSLPPSPIRLEAPAAAVWQSALASGQQALVAALYEGTLARNGLSRLDGQEEAQRLNRLGILHSSFGETLKANDAFASALKAKPDFYPAAINLANLCLLQGRLEQAGAYLARARELRPQSAAVEALARRLSVTPGPGAAVVAEPAAILAINGQAGASSIQRSSNTAAMPVWEE